MDYDCEGLEFFIGYGASLAIGQGCPTTVTGAYNDLMFPQVWSPAVEYQPPGEATTPPFRLNAITGSL